MARVAFVKVFAGLNLGMAQLAGELHRAGHDTRTIFFKEYRVIPEEDWGKYESAEMAGVWIAARAKLFNFNCYTPFSEEDFSLLINELRAYDPDLIGLSMSSMSINESAIVTQRIKKFFDVPVIWGGSGPTLQPEKALEYADMVCVGEGEEAIVELADAIDAGKDFTGIRNVWVKHGDKIIKNEGRPLVSMDAIAEPDFAESRLVYISDGKVRRNLYPPNFGRQYHIMTQRGCPYSCSFCIESWYQDKYGRKESLRRRSIDLVIRELVRVKEQHGVKAVLFYDDVFTVNSKWIKDFAPRYKEEVGLPFWCYTYPKTTRRDDLLLLKDAGLKSVTVGVQSGSFDVLKEYNRPVQPETAVDAAKVIIDCGVDGFFEMITRSEFDTEQTLRDTFEFMMAMPTKMKTFGFYPMVKFPDYGYTEKVREREMQIKISDEDYLYYHKIYLLTRTDLPRKLVRMLGESKAVRRLMRHVPNLIDPLLPKTLPIFQLNDHVLDLSQGEEGPSSVDASKDEGWIGFVVPDSTDRPPSAGMSN